MSKSRVFLITFESGIPRCGIMWEYIISDGGQEMKRAAVLNELQLKCLLVVLMVLDHLSNIKGVLPDGLCTVFHIMSRGVAPAFAYFAVEGIIHTRNLKKYNIRLLAAALIMEFGNRIINFYFITHAVTGVDKGFLISNHSRWLYVHFIDRTDGSFLITNDIFLTLFFLVFGVSLIIWSRDRVRIQKMSMYFLAVMSWITAFLYCEWGVVLTPFFICTYFFRDNKVRFYMSCVLIELIAIFFRSEVFYFLVFPIICLYNGKRGPKNRLSKMFFYFFYPVHLWIIYIINYCLNT